MTNSTSTFTPSNQILEAGEKESYFNPLLEIRPITPEDPDYQVFNEAHQIQNEPSWLESISASLPDPIVHNLPRVIEPGDPEYQSLIQAIKQAEVGKADDAIIVGELPHGLTLPAPSESARLAAAAATTPISTPGEIVHNVYATPLIDSDEGLAQPWLPEVGVDVLA